MQERLCPKCESEVGEIQSKECLFEKALRSYSNAPDELSGEKMGELVVIMGKASDRNCPKLVPFIKSILKNTRDSDGILKENQG